MIEELQQFDKIYVNTQYVEIFFIHIPKHNTKLVPWHVSHECETFIQREKIFSNSASKLK